MNVQIIHPQWLMTIGAISESDAYQIQVNFSSPGFRLLDDKRKELIWTVQPDKLSVESAKCDGAEWDAVQKVAENLPWTPLNAIGTNFYFDLIEGADKALIEAFDTIKAPSPFYRVVANGQNWSFSRDRSPIVSNVGLNCEGSKCSVIVNFHTDLSTLATPTPQLDAVKLAVADFSQKRDESFFLANACYDSLIK